LKQANTKNAVLILLFLAVTQLMPTCLAISSDEAGEAIEQAERNLGSAYIAVAEAESAGANVSMLLSKLRIAANLLSEAHMAFRIRDYDNSSSFAAASNHAIEGAVDEGVHLKEDAEREKINSFLLTAVLSVVGVILVLILGLLGWQYVKRVYFKQILGTKPRVEKK
jgi:hypothetical protein